MIQLIVGRGGPRNSRAQRLSGLKDPLDLYEAPGHVHSETVAPSGTGTPTPNGPVVEIGAPRQDTMQKSIREPTSVDELAVSDKLFEMFRSKQMTDYMGAKGHENLNATMKSLLEDVDSDGHLMDPRKWGIPWQ
eukprot:9474558-Pyramimonas_sp.AAC.1